MKLTTRCNRVPPTGSCEAPAFFTGCSRLTFCFDKLLERLGELTSCFWGPVVFSPDFDVLLDMSALADTNLDQPLRSPFDLLLGTAAVALQTDVQVWKGGCTLSSLTAAAVTSFHRAVSDEYAACKQRRACRSNSCVDALSQPAKLQEHTNRAGALLRAAWESDFS